MHSKTIEQFSTFTKRLNPLKYFIFFANLLFILFIYLNFPREFSLVSDAPLEQFHEHYSLEHSDFNHYTLPISQITEYINLTNASANILSFPRSSRGIPNCKHFESELNCNEIEFAAYQINKTVNSKRYMIVELPNDLKSAINTLHFAFVVSIASERKLYFRNYRNVEKLFKLPDATKLIPESIVRKKHYMFRSYQINKCSMFSILSCRYRGIELIGKWDISTLLLSPNVIDKIPDPFKTHGFFILSRWISIVSSIEFPPDQLQIGISLEFQPDHTNFLKVIQVLTEGYSNWTLNIWESNRFSLPKELQSNIKIIKQFSDAIQVLPQCDKFIGTLGHFQSHLLSKIRGRGGIWFDPRNSLKVETRNSQAGHLFLMKNTGVSELMCPGAMSSLQRYLEFNAV